LKNREGKNSHILHKQRTRLLHCNFSSEIIGTPCSSNQNFHIKKKQTWELDLVGTQNLVVKLLFCICLPTTQTNWTSEANPQTQNGWLSLHTVAYRNSLT